jgi:hypothetical protein
MFWINADIPLFVAITLLVCRLSVLVAIHTFIQYDDSNFILIIIVTFLHN